MKTFNQELKTKWINIMQSHQDADKLVQGNWFDSKTHQGCFFGCAMQTDDNPLSKAIEEMNLPAWLIYLSEKIFEGLPREQAVLFPVQLLNAIPVNSDIESIRHQLAVIRLTRLINDNNGDDVNNAIKMVINYHKNPSESARLAASSAASSAAWSAASSAAWSAASSAAWSAARLAASSAASSAAWSAASSAAWSAWPQERDDLISLLKKVKQ